MKITINVTVEDPTAPTAGELNAGTDATPCHCTGGRPCYHCATIGSMEGYVSGGNSLVEQRWGE